MKKEPKAQTQAQNSPNCLYWFCQNKLHPQRPRPATHRTPWISCQCALARHHKVFPDVTCLCPGWSELFWQHSMRQVVLWWILVSNIAPYCLDGAFLQHPCNMKCENQCSLNILSSCSNRLLFQMVLFLFAEEEVATGTTNLKPRQMSFIVIFSSLTAGTTAEFCVSGKTWVWYLLSAVLNHKITKF